MDILLKLGIILSIIFIPYWVGNIDKREDTINNISKWFKGFLIIIFFSLIGFFIAFCSHWLGKWIYY